MSDMRDERSFEELLAELESVTDRLATGELGIEAATDLYEHAERLHALATARLVEVQSRVERLSQRAAAGPGSPSERRDERAGPTALSRDRLLP
jgi:exodeoxyribonuclease VII small subunit